jgi:hypothetical protein
MMKATFIYLLPPFLIDLVKIIRAFFKYLKNFKLLNSNREMFNLKQGKAVYVLANGPSLNAFDIESLFGKDVIVMNNFDLCKWKDKVNIVAHCIGEPKTSPHWGDNQIEIINNTNALSYWFHISVRKDVKRYLNDNTKKNIYYVQPSLPIINLKWFSEVQLHYSCLGYKTTAQYAIMVAMYMGFKEIRLIGFDHDMLCNRNVSPHFYKEREGVQKVDLSVHSYYKLLNTAKEMWEYYYKLKSITDKLGIRIINLSQPTFLDVFDFE